MNANKKTQSSLVLKKAIEDNEKRKALTSESQGINNDTQIRILMEQYLKIDNSSERVRLYKEYRNGAPITGPEGLRKKLGALDLEYFGKAYLPHYFYRTGPEFHRELDKLWTGGVLKNLIPFNKETADTISRLDGCRRAAAAPRGHAKSTNLTFKDALHAILYAYKHYILILSDSSDQAEGFLEDISSALEENSAIIEDFGELQGKVWRDDVILTTTNIKVDAIGSGKKVRGRRHKNWRPDLIILDDIENDDNVRTPEQRKKLENWFYKAVSKSGDTYTDIVYIGTILHYDSLLSKVLRNPSYKAVKYKAVISFAKRKDLWDQWEGIYVDLNNDNREQDARAFFDEHRVDMLDGTKVLWEDKLPYYDLMVMKVSEGEASFNSEEQNEPINPEDCLFNMDSFEYFNELEIDFSDKRFRFYGFVDPSLGKTKKSDFSAIQTLAKDTKTGYMYDLDADIERRHPDKIIEDVLEKEKWLINTFGRGYEKLGCETNQFQWFLKEKLAEASAAAGLYIPIVEVNQNSDKIMRVQTLQPDLKNKYIKLNPKHKRLLEQLQYFPKADHDDGPDALESCRTLCKSKKTADPNALSILKRLRIYG